MRHPLSYPRYWTSTLALSAGLVLTGCQVEPLPGLTAFTGFRLIDGTGVDPVENAILVVRDGRIEAVGSRDENVLPAGATVVDLSGRSVVPGLINAHGHVGGTLGLEGGHYTRENLLRQLGLYARYGVTTVNSLGGDGPEGFALQREQDSGGLKRARLFAAGEVVVGATPEEAITMVDRNAEAGAHFIKLRVDDNLGSTEKMAPEVWSAVVERAGEQGLPVAAHIFYLEDAKALLRQGIQMVAHSVRDVPVDDEFLQLMEQSGACYVPTLTREISTFAYEGEPEWFRDPFFLAEADPVVLEQLRNPQRQAAVRESASAQAYKVALDVALENLKRVSDAGIPVALGTDTGPPGRFQGFFEHLEMALMAQAGLSPEQILVAATRDAARCIGVDAVGTLEVGKWADFVVLDGDPLENSLNLREIRSVWVAGNRVPEA